MKTLAFQKLEIIQNNTVPKIVASKYCCYLASVFKFKSARHEKVFFPPRTFSRPPPHPWYFLYQNAKCIPCF